MKKPLISKKESGNLIKKHGSPLYVYRKSIVKDRYLELKNAINYPKTKIYYACKANANAELLKLLLNLGASIECVSRGEVERALAVGFPGDRISYTCSNIPKGEIAWLVKQGVSVHLDSLTQLEWWGKLKPMSDVSVRLNLGYGDGGHKYLITGGDDSKFGIYHKDIPQLQKIAKKHGLRIKGILQHIGTHIADPHSLLRGMELVFAIAHTFPDLRFLDFGGGFNTPYKPTEKPIDIENIGAKMSARFQKFCDAYGRPLELRIEPGRFIVADAGALLTTVVDIKQTAKNIFVGIDTGFSHLIRPALYGSYHHIFNLSNPRGSLRSVSVVGNICESADIFARGRKLPRARVGDLLLIADAGAYGYSMASDYNLRAKPKEVVID